jgi:hypothetical protein
VLDEVNGTRVGFNNNDLNQQLKATG